MIFLDTSAIFAMADRGDANHRRALEAFSRALAGGETMVVHGYVIGEAAALLQARLGLPSALRFLAEVERFHIEWIDPALHREAVLELAKHRRRRVSLVDCASFVVMRRLGIAVAHAMDPHFAQAGFRLLAP